MKSDIFNAEWCDIVFEGRNQEYGAYSLRKISNKNALIAVIVAIVIIILGSATPLILEFIKSSTADDAVKITEVNTLAEPPPIDKDEPPPPPVEPPPPLKTTIKFTPPVIVKDEEVKDTMRTQEELKDVEVAAKTQTGDSTGVDPSLIDDGNKVIEDPTKNQIFTIVEQMPEFPGGEVEMIKYIVKNTHYPQIAKENGISGKVFLTFVVDQEGKVNDVKILRGIGGGCDEEAIRVVKSMPAWKPGKQNGRPVKVQYNLPYNFTLK